MKKEIYTDIYECFGNGIPVVPDCFLPDNRKHIS
jgi:hypothetical protein